MSIQGWYFLDKDCALRYVAGSGAAPDLREDHNVKMLWSFDPGNRECAWGILIEAAALGAKPERIKQLAELWQCDDVDADVYADRVGCNLFLDGDQWCATDIHFTNLQESAAGFGSSKLEAMAELCKDLGWKPAKTWGNHFPDLLSRRENAQFGVGA